MTSDPGPLAYIAIFVAAAVEGEVIFVAASAAVATGGLSAAGVLVAGALGASAGDQAFFHAVRHWPRRWSERLPAGASAHLAAVTSRVRQHATLMILACRFLPGLRIAIPVACAASGVPARRFVALDLVSAFAWAASIMILVAKAGPAGASRLGLHGAATVLVPALIITIIVVWGGKALSRRIDHER